MILQQLQTRADGLDAAVGIVCNDIHPNKGPKMNKTMLYAAAVAIVLAGCDKPAPVVVQQPAPATPPPVVVTPPADQTAADKAADAARDAAKSADKSKDAAADAKDAANKASDASKDTKKY